MDWFKLGKGVCQGCILSPYLFNFCAEYITWNSGLNDSQAGIKIARTNNNHLWYADDTILMAENKEELKSLLMKVKEESENGGLKLNTQKTKIITSSPITSWQIRGETMATVTNYFLAVILEHKKVVCHCFHCFPIYLPWSDGPRFHDLHFSNAEF